MTISAKDWQAMFSELESAKKELEGAERAENNARSVSTAARNRINKIQRDIEKALEEEKKSAPHGSDWHDKIHRRECA